MHWVTFQWLEYHDSRTFFRNPRGGRCPSLIRKQRARITRIVGGGEGEGKGRGMTMRENGVWRGQWGLSWACGRGKGRCHALGITRLQVSEAGTAVPVHSTKVASDGDAENRPRDRHLGAQAVSESCEWARGSAGNYMLARHSRYRWR